jgi:hypothetical protein
MKVTLNMKPMRTKKVHIIIINLIKFKFTNTYIFKIEEYALEINDLDLSWDKKETNLKKY